MSEKSENITIKKQDLWKYSTFLLLVVVIILAIVAFGGNSCATANTVNNPAQENEGVNERASVSVDDDAFIGNEDAPVTIIEFSDYQCPFCRKFWTETYSQIKSDYIDSGKVKLVFRDFPLGFHEMAQPSAEAAECVREKGGDEAYFKFHDKMFEEQNILDSGSPNGAVSRTVSYTNSDLKDWAKDLGYDIASCLDSGKMRSEVQKDLSDGSSAGVSGTPSFFVNGIPVSGAQPYVVFKQVIDQELAN